MNYLGLMMLGYAMKLLTQPTGEVYGYGKF